MLVLVGVPEGDENEGVVGDLRYIYTFGYGHFDRTVCYWSVDILFDLTDLVFGNSAQPNSTIPSSSPGYLSIHLPTPRLIKSFHPLITAALQQHQ